jgi:RND family efflux transporter MFP subunit
MRKRKLRWVLLAIAIALGAFFLLRHSHHTSADAPAEAALKTVAVARVTREDLARSVSLTAELKPYQDINVHAKVAGFVKEMKVDIGDEVKAGQVIATLDIAEQQADMAKADATYNEAKLDYNRIQGVIHKRPGLLAQDEVDKAKATYEVAKAEREHVQALNDYATITAPFNGIITKRFADKGALIQAGTASNTQAMPLVHLSDNTRLRLEFPVPESIVPLIKVGTPVDVTVQATNDTLHSKVVRISGMIDSATRTMEVEVDLDNPDLRLTPGMYASVHIDLNTQAGSLAVPVQAIAGQDKPTLWVVNAQNKVEERLVTLGIQTPDKVEILSGVSEGEMVIFGSRTVSLGAPVNPKLVEGSKS